MNVMLAKKYDNAQRIKISEVFVEGFYQWLKFFSKDKAKLAHAFEHMFNLSVFYVAVIDDEVAGIAACADESSSSIRLEKAESKKHLGLIKGSIAFRILKRELEDKQYPFTIEKGMGMIEFVATSAKHRGKGVATAILNNIFDYTAYSVFALEVADTNENAVRLYEKLGFAEFMRVKHKHSKQSGINHLVYMKYFK